MTLLETLVSLIPAEIGGKLLLNYLENKKIPVLKFDIFTKTNDELNPIYFVRVRNVKGEGKAENCIGKIDMGNSHYQTVWANQSEKIEILHDSHEDLRLFKMEYEKTTTPIQEKSIPKTICIPILKSKNSKKKGEIFDESPKSFEDYKNIEIKIKIDADRGKPTSLTKKISEIIDKAIVEKS